MYVCKNFHKNMIKIGVFGISGETITLTGRIKKDDNAVLTGFHLPAAPGAGLSRENRIFLNTDPEEVIMSSDCLLFADPHPDEMVFIRAAIRMSRPLFFLGTSRLPAGALPEIRDLAVEGGVHVHCYNPLRDHPLFAAAAAMAGRPFFTEIIRRWPGETSAGRLLTDNLLPSLEAVLHLNSTRPRRPLVGAYLLPDGAAGMVHLQMEFDDSMTALIRHEIPGEKETLLCRITGGEGTATADMAGGSLRFLDNGHTRSAQKKKIPVAGASDPLYHSWNAFLRQCAAPHPAVLEERIQAARLLEYALEKVRNKTIPSLSPEKNW